ncbi:MAG TPA: hypothetical protein VNO70_09190 [Blastocatellia bacterium]|nr:hypothetical protein [Blastocatellia bacterium]
MKSQRLDNAIAARSDGRNSDAVVEATSAAIEVLEVMLRNLGIPHKFPGEETIDWNAVPPETVRDLLEAGVNYKVITPQQGEIISRSHALSQGIRRGKDLSVPDASADEIINLAVALETTQRQL